ncbi:DUF5694 domain-containing protein [Neolewinella sp.]|uniref:DUF5694 domain-containing protein n=1 Tax=Neolewinella sp. TaxID=2993543 RepID=UPI003B515DAF
MPTLHYLPILLSLALFGHLSAQRTDTFLPFDPDSILVGDRQLPKVLLIGSWHFNYPGLDAHKAETEDQINIYSEERQRELQELLNYIVRFKPSKIVVESGANTGYLLNNYRRYLAGEEELYASERSQIGMRLMDRSGLDTVYGVDAWPLLLELHDGRDTTQPMGYVDEILDRHYFGGTDEASQRYSAYYSYQDSLIAAQSLLASFQYLNSDKVLDRIFGAYLYGGQFESEDFEGPDALSMFWFNRNLRIFKRIKDLEHGPEDRLLILFGAGHAAILRYLFECSPEFELVDFDSL